MFVDVFIRRPILSSVIAVVIVLAGAISIPSLPIAQYPQLAPPQVQVSTVYIGASALVVETTVTRPLEEAINGAQGMTYMTSTSGNDGTSSITVNFDVTRDPMETENLAKSAQCDAIADEPRERVLCWDRETPWLGA